MASYETAKGETSAASSSVPGDKLTEVKEPPSYEHFMLKDLDTGMKSYVTDTEWIEQPVVPSTFLPDPQRPDDADVTVSPSAAVYSTGGFENGAREGFVSTKDVSTGRREGVGASAFANTDYNGGDRPPAAPGGIPRTAVRGRQTRRARSDEVTADRGLFRPSEHVRVIAHKKRERDFINVYRWQSVHGHTGAIRVLRFNSGGEWLASAGADRLVKVWRIDRRLSHARESSDTLIDSHGRSVEIPGSTAPTRNNDTKYPTSGYSYIRDKAPFLTCRGHTSDVTDLSWSKNNFLLSASADRSMRLWHPRSKTCLRRILLNDIVTSVSFHPTDEQICIAGLSNGMITMWHMKEDKMLSEADTDELVTAVAITPDGTTALVGTLRGRCKLYALFDEIQFEWQFRHTTQLDVRSRRAKNASGKKICGFQFTNKGDKVLISSNDSRLRLYRLDDKSMMTKFVGGVNSESRLSGSFDPLGRYMLCGTENRSVVIWDMPAVEGTSCKPSINGRGNISNLNSASTSRSVDDDETDVAHKKDAGFVHETFVVQEKGIVTAALFAPTIVPRDNMFLYAPTSNPKTCGLVIITASDDGFIRVFGCC